MDKCLDQDNCNIGETITKADIASYSHRLGYQYGECLGNIRGLHLGRESALLLIAEGSINSATTELDKLTIDQRVKFQELIEENIRRDYELFNENDKIMVRRNYEDPDITARGFVGGYRSKFENSYRRSFMETYELSLVDEASAIGRADGLEAANRVVATTASTYQDLIQSATMLGQEAALKVGMSVVRLLPDVDVTSVEFNQRVDNYLATVVPDTLIEEVSESLTDEVIDGLRESNLETSLNDFKTKYDTCDALCIEEYTVAFRDSFNSISRDEFIRAFEEEYYRIVETSFRQLWNGLSNLLVKE